MIARKQGNKETRKQQCSNVSLFPCSNDQSGQGLLETIVAIGVITTGLVSIISLVISNLTTQRETSTRYQAVNLAREGIELIRNKRDSNWLDSEKDIWDGITDVKNLVESATPAPFEREIDLIFHTCEDIFLSADACANFGESGTGNIALDATSTVTWQDQGRQREVKLTETLYDWR